MSRDLPAEQAPPAIGSGGPPRLNLSGGKPSWRDREAARSSSQTPSASAEPEAAPAPAPAPKRTGYVPPAMRRGEDGSPAPPAAGWRAREGSGRGREPREESPATGPSRFGPSGRTGSFRDSGERMRTQSPATGGKFVPPALRGRTEVARDGAREGEREGGREREREREPLPPPTQAPSDGKYRPGAFRSRREG